MIQALLYRFGYVRTDRAKGWVHAAADDARVRGILKLESHYARTQRHTAFQKKTSYEAGKVAGRASRVTEEVQKAAGEIAAERDGYKAQLGLAERKLKSANERLQAYGLMPVTSFFC